MQSERLPQALAGKKVLVTRARRQASAMCARIRAYGGIPILLPVLAYRPVPLGMWEKERWFDAVRQADWLVFTSANGIDAFMHLIKPTKLPPDARIAAVGKKTADYLRASGLTVDFVPESFSEKGLLEAFRTRQIEAKRVAVPLGSLSHTSWLDRLKEMGIRVDTCLLYETIADRSNAARLADVAGSSDLAAITFASPSAVRFFCELLPDGWWREAMKRCTVAVIGPATARALTSLGYAPDVTPVHYTAVDLIDTLATYYLNLNHEGSR
ncbi:MAG: uroporphyrinogen-III synthase [Sporolactobacillus sp.]|jgi:uroporphyrinogen-III synthase|nr:uroporphyrinogen-III synthase [Sporolactobacillus sp.]